MHILRQSMQHGRSLPEAAAAAAAAPAAAAGAASKAKCQIQ